jgi:hypothetical protein
VGEKHKIRKLAEVKSKKVNGVPLAANDILTRSSELGYFFQPARRITNHSELWLPFVIAELSFLLGVAK